MLDIFLQLGLFAGKTLIVLIFVFLVLILFVGLVAKGKEKSKGHLIVRNLKKKYTEDKELITDETLSKKELKALAKQQKKEEKAKAKDEKIPKRIYVLNYHGDVKASGVETLAREINAVLQVATSKDEIVLRLESGGGVVHGYGLAAAQLMRIRDKNIPLTITVDKIAASGGYMMACIANKLLAAPFAIIGSIGVIVQLPNFHRVLKDKHIDFEQQTAGEYKRTLTIFGENTDEGRAKLQEDIEEIHDQFKHLITEHRPQLDINQVATGEHWLGQQALSLKLVDALQTSDDYLLASSKDADIYEIYTHTKKRFIEKVAGASFSLIKNLLAKI